MLVFKISNFKIDSTIPAMLMNILFFMGSHYLLKQQGGWVGIQDKLSLINFKKERKSKLVKLVKLVRNFNFFTFCQNNSPKQDYIYSIFGLFSIVSIFSAIYSISRETLQQESDFLQLINHSVLIVSKRGIRDGPLYQFKLLVFSFILSPFSADRGISVIVLKFRSLVNSL